VSLPVILSPGAEADLAAVRQWYERLREGLGDKFLDCADGEFERISGMPEMYGVVYRGVRRCMLHRFPYVVYYRVRAERIDVLGVFHARQHPRSWRSRVQ